MPTANILIMSVLLMMMHCYGLPTTLVVERIDSLELEHNQLVARDRLRHDRVFLRNSSSLLPGVVQFPLQGSADPYKIVQLGRYFTRVKLGNPAREYSLLVDTGSDVTWVNCLSCVGCPRTSGLIELSFYDLHNSSSAASISCSNKICESAQNQGCSSSLCSYTFNYGDGSTISGYYVSDVFHFDTVTDSSVTTISSENIVFGCSNNESGPLTEQGIAVDGILGLGHHPMSITSQLASRKITPNIFGHCLRGDQSGGGILVLGEILEPGIVYTPLILSEPHYHVSLLSISIGGQTVPIHPEVFATSRNQGVIIDSGSIFTYLAEEAYHAFVTALVAAVFPIVSSFSDDGKPCFLISDSDAFPQVSLNFAGGASMILRPEEYLRKHPDIGPGIWCLALEKNQLQISHRLTILGEQVMKDKIIIYDLARERFGWANYNCTSSLNVSFVLPRVSRASRDAVFTVYLDIGLAVPKLSVLGVISSVKELLELAPTKKLVEG